MLHFILVPDSICLMTTPGALATMGGDSMERILHAWKDKYKNVQAKILLILQHMYFLWDLLSIQKNVCSTYTSIISLPTLWKFFVATCSFSYLKPGNVSNATSWLHIIMSCFMDLALFPRSLFTTAIRPAVVWQSFILSSSSGFHCRIFVQYVWTLPSYSIEDETMDR